MVLRGGMRAGLSGLLLTSICLLLTLGGITAHVWRACYTSPDMADAAGGPRAASQLRYADTLDPMQSAADGFFYLAATGDILRQGPADSGSAGSALVPASSFSFSSLASGPALSWLTAQLHVLSGLRVTTLALWLPVLTGVLFVGLYTLWGRLLGLNLWQTGAAAVFGTLVPAWIERSRLGWFDTDPGIALLWNACLLTSACLTWSGVPAWARGSQGAQEAKGKDAESKTGETAWAVSLHFLGRAVLLLLWGGLLAWWWKPGAVLLPLCLGLWACSFIWSRRLWEKRLRMILCVLLVLCAALFVLLPDTAFAPLTQIRNYAVEHLRLILGMKGDVISASIDEIKALPLEESLKNIGGNSVGGLCMLLALLCFCVRFPAAAWFFVPSLGALAMGFVSERFLYLAALPLGLAAAALPAIVLDWCRVRDGRLRLAGYVLVWGLLLGCLLHWLLAWQPSGYFTQGHDSVAVALRRASPPQAPVWAWWDDGYFLRARAGLMPFFDGGSQEALRAYIVARPFMSEDPRLSRRWIRFFALRGQAGLNPLLAAWGDESTVWRNLEAIFAADQPELVCATLPPLTAGNPAATMDWLFPDGRVFLYFSQRILRLSQWWGTLGSQRHADMSHLRSCVDVFAKGSFSYAPQSQTVRLPDEALRKGYSSVSAVYNTHVQPLSPPWPEEDGLFAVNSAYSRWLYLVNKAGLTSLPLRLMAPGGAVLPGFRLVAADYDNAGAWEVLP